MKIRISFIILGILIVFSNLTIAQVSHTEQITGKPVLNKQTGAKISEERLHELMVSDPNFILEQIINKYGEVESFLYDPTRKGKSLTRDTSLRTKAGELLPPFVVRSVTGKKIDSETCHGRPILVLFQLFFKAPFFNETQFHQFKLMADTLKGKGDLEIIVITDSTNDEIKSAIDVKNSNFQVVPEGRNFSVRYLVTKFPSYLLIDKEGKLVYYYEENNITKLQHDIVSNLF